MVQFKFAILIAVKYLKIVNVSVGKYKYGVLCPFCAISYEHFLNYGQIIC
jgi:hypothetical protein